MSQLASPIVAVDWLKDHASDDDVVVADVRPYDAYAAAHLPGAIHVDLSTLRLASSAPDSLAAWKERLQAVIRSYGIAPEQSVIFYEDFSGTMSAYGVWLLDAAGLGNGAMLDGGIRAWHASGLPLSNEIVLPTPSETVIQANDAVVATAEGIMASLEQDDAKSQLVDTRATHEFGQGSIPGAVHVDWMNHLNSEGSFKPMDELDQLYANAGLSKDDEVASYCAGGFRAANTYVVLKALGYTGAANYAPSWGEWGYRQDTPIERH